MFPLFYDPTMIIVLPAIILALYAQAKVQGTFRHYLNVRANSGLTGAQVAEEILRRQGLDEVRVEMVPGNLTDHNDPRSRVVRLSNAVYNGYSLAALGVAAHETGHALQHATHYLPLNIRHSLVPVANIGSRLGLPLAIIGIFLFQSQLMLQAGIILFAGAVLFQVVTLPVEYNASTRALALLEKGGYLGRREVDGAKEVLNAAALTYVAATLVALLHLVRLLLLASRFSGGRRR